MIDILKEAVTYEGCPVREDEMYFIEAPYGILRGKFIKKELYHDREYVIWEMTFLINGERKKFNTAIDEIEVWAHLPDRYSLPNTNEIPF